MSACVWIVVGVAGGLLLVPRRRNAFLGLPVEADALQPTPHGAFGAKRKGPPEHTHQGIDLVAPPGSLVLAIGDGEIVRTGAGLGKVVRKLRLDAPAAWVGGAVPIASVVYADLGATLVDPGDRVRVGDPIAKVAPRGFVHFAVKTEDERFIDPRFAGFTISRREVA